MGRAFFSIGIRIIFIATATAVPAPPAPDPPSKLPDHQVKTKPITTSYEKLALTPGTTRGKEDKVPDKSRSDRWAT